MSAPIISQLKVLQIVALFLLFINGINALAAGYSFMTDPSGKGIGMSTDFLDKSVFKDFLIPGIILFMANGLMSIITAIIVSMKHKHYPYWIILQGSILTGWIIIQLNLVKYFHPLHLIMGVIGIVLIVTGLLIKRNLQLLKKQ